MNRFSPKNSLLVILLLAVFLRLIGIVSRPIWYDEALSLLYAQNTPQEIVYAMLGSGWTAANVHTPIYFIGLWAWTNFFGNSVIVARLFSVLFGLATLGAVYFLSKDLFGDIRFANFAFFIIAVSPFHIHHSQEIRMYGVMAGFLIWCTFFYFRAVKTLQIRWWVLFALFAAVAQYLQSLAAFYLVALAISALATKHPRIILRTILAGLGALVLYLPWLLHLPSQLARIQSAYWVNVPNISNLINLLLVYVSNLPLPIYFLPSIFFIVMLVTTLAAYQTIKMLYNRKSSIEPFYGAWLAYLGIAPALLMFLVSLRFPVFLERALLPSGVMFLLWLAWAFYRTPIPDVLRRCSLVLLLFVFGVGLYQHVFYSGFPYVFHQVIAHFLQENIVDEQTLIIHSNKLSLPPVHYADLTLKQVFIADPPGSRTDTLARETQQVIGVTAVDDLNVATRSANTVFLVIFQESRNEAYQAGLSEHPHIMWMDKHFYRQSEHIFGDVLVYRYLRIP